MTKITLTVDQIEQVLSEYRETFLFALGYYDTEKEEFYHRIYRFWRRLLIPPVGDVILDDKTLAQRLLWCKFNKIVPTVAPMFRDDIIQIVNSAPQGPKAIERDANIACQVEPLLDWFWELMALFDIDPLYVARHVYTNEPFDPVTGDCKVSEEFSWRLGDG